MQSRLLVYPANQPSCDVPVFPAPGAVNPLSRTTSAVPLFITPSSMLVMTAAIRGSSTCAFSVPKFMTMSPLALRTEFTNSGESRMPPLAKLV